MATLKNTSITVTGNTTGALQLPVGTTTERPSAVTGRIRYNSTLKTVETYNATRWEYIPDIIRDGLILYLDAAEPSSYPGSGTTWTDLSGRGNNGTLTNGPTYNSSNGGFLVFDGINDYCRHLLSSRTEARTISIWFFDDSGITPDGSNAPPKTGYQIANFGTSGILNQFDGITKGSWTGGAVNETLGYYQNSPARFIYMRDEVSVGWHQFVMRYNDSAGIYDFFLDGRQREVFIASQGNMGLMSADRVIIGAPGDPPTVGTGGQDYYGRNNFAQILLYNRSLKNQEIEQNFNVVRERFVIVDTQLTYQNLTYTVSANLSVTANGTNNVSIFKTSGSNSWDNQAYSTTPFTAPCTIEFNKQAAATDNGVSYAMIAWNVDPTTDANYTSLDYTSYPYQTNSYQVYNNGSYVGGFGSWSTANKFYLVYDKDGFIRHYNGSTLLYSVSYGTGKTVYVDSSFYSPNATFGGFSNIRACQFSWNGTTYTS